MQAMHISTACAYTPGDLHASYMTGCHCTRYLPFCMVIGTSSLWFKARGPNGPNGMLSGLKQGTGSPHGILIFPSSSTWSSHRNRGSLPSYRPASNTIGVHGVPSQWT